MTNQFMVQTREIFLFEESEFLAHGGRTVRFGAVDGNVVRLEATGSAGAIAYRPAPSFVIARRPADQSPQPRLSRVGSNVETVGDASPRRRRRTLALSCVACRVAVLRVLRWCA